MNTFFTALVTVPPLIVAMVFHEVAHGKVAEMLGDPTARSLGRISLNPIRHIDPFMSIILPGFLILSGSPFVLGGAKPVPVNPGYFRNPRRGMGIVAVAGPLTNVALALLSIGGLEIVRLLAPHLPQTIAIYLVYTMVYSTIINVVLCCFNLVPVPPLDGGRIVTAILPLSLAKSYARLEKYGLLIVVALLFSGAIGKVLGPIVEFSLEMIGV